MRRSIVVYWGLCAVSSLCLAADSNAPRWPEIGSRWELDRTHAAVRADLMGTATWDNPPAVISPYESNWFDYVPILWGEDRRLPDPVVYNAVLRQMYFCGGMNYSRDKPDGFAKTRLPFYCTNLANLLYIRNKSGPKIREAFEIGRAHV